MSIQASVVKLFMRFQRVISPPPKELNLSKERAGMDHLSKLCKPLAGVKYTSVDVNGVTGDTA